MGYFAEWQWTEIRPLDETEILRAGKTTKRREIADVLFFFAFMSVEGI